jgi:hypothetical protein
MTRSQYGVLILEGNWGEDETTYLTDSRSASRLYSALEDLLSLGSRPVKFIQRPLLAGRFVEDVRNFVLLTKDQGRGTVIILSAHGSRRKTKTGKKRRVLQAFDDKLNLSLRIKDVGDVLGKTILILDSCEIGEKLEPFQRVAKALAVIGFSEDVDWVESAVFILAFLDKLGEYRYFSKKADIRHAATAAIKAMWSTPYKSLAEHLGAKKVIGNKFDRIIDKKRKNLR